MVPEKPTRNKNMKELNQLELMNVNGGIGDELWALIQATQSAQTAADLWAEWTATYGQYQQ
jgi:hypothetical protein